MSKRKLNRWQWAIAFLTIRGPMTKAALKSAMADVGAKTSKVLAKLRKRKLVEDSGTLITLVRK
jgi:hypothetical protein